MQSVFWQWLKRAQEADCQKQSLETREMALSVKRLLYRSEDPSSIPRTYKKSAVALHL